MQTDNHGAQHQSLGRCLRFAVLIVVGFTASASAEQPQSVPIEPGGTKIEGQPRKATLQEIYGMFFNFAAHVEARSNEDEKHGKDRTFYRHNLQKDSGLTPDEYAQVLASAKRFVAIDADVKKRIDDLNKAARGNGPTPPVFSDLQSAEYRAQLDSLYVEHNSALDAEIANLRQALGPERADMLDAYLQNGFPSRSSGSARPEKRESTTPRSQLRQSPDNVSLGWPTYHCWNYQDSMGNPFSLCMEMTLSYLGPTDQVEVWGYSTYTYNFPPGEFDGWSYYYKLYENGNDVTNQYYNCNNGVAPCDFELKYGNGTLYTLYDYIDFYYWDVATCGSVYPCDAYTHQEICWVTINYPQMSGPPSPNPLTQGSSGTLTINGTNLISPFQNTPKVTVNNQAAIFSNFQIASFSASSISINYTVLAGAPVGTDIVTVSNGFGADSRYSITIKASNPPTITSVTVEGSSDNALQANTQQTVLLTGTNFGSSDQITVLTDGQYITVSNVGQPQGGQLSFTATTAANAPSGSADFDLIRTDNAQATSPNVVVDPITPPPPQIMIGADSGGSLCATGTNVANTIQNVYVGQQISITGCVTTTWFADVSSSWTPNTFPITAAVAGFSVAPFPVYTETLSLVQPTSCASFLPFCDFTPFYFVAQGPQTLTFTYDLGNGTSPASSYVTLNVLGPTGYQSPNGVQATMGSVDTEPLQGNPNFNAQMLLDGVIYNNGQNEAGILFHAVGTEPASNLGIYNWLQLVYTSRQQLDANFRGTCPGGPAPGTVDLDGGYPYGYLNNVNIGTVFQSPGGVPNDTATDAPQSFLNTTMGEVARSFSATMYLLWTPNADPNCTNGSGCTIPVPLGSLTWSFDGDTINTLNPEFNQTTWGLSCEYPRTNGQEQVTFSPSSSYPIWTAMIGPGGQVVTCP